MTGRIGEQFGKYRFIRLLGQGTFAEVYLGEHLYLKSEAAVKVLRTHLSERDAERFLNEAQTIARLLHPHIVRIFDFDVQEGTPFLVMDYAPNGTLRQRHPGRQTVPLPMIIQYVKQIADALQYAHDQKLIHRDVKPENILLGRRNEILLSDFGIVQVMQTTTLSSLHDIAGTAAYMAPEQFAGKAGFASDQYALAIMVYQWLSGKLPFYGSFSEMTSQHLFVSPSPLSETNPSVPPAVQEVVMTALAKDPKQRFASVRAFARALEQATFPTSTSLSLPTYAPTTPIPPTSPVIALTIDQAQLSQRQSLVPSSPSLSPVSGTPVVTSPSGPIEPQRLPESHTDHGGSHPAGTSAANLARPQHKKNFKWTLLLLGLAILVIASTLTTAILVNLEKSSKKPLLLNPISVSVATDGEHIGLSDGNFAFDTSRPDGTLKLQAADAFNRKNIVDAKALWQAAITKETNDAEALIYQEDQRVLVSGHPYITLVVGTILTGDLVSIGRDNLQGAYVAQKEFNDAFKLPGRVQVRFLIANSGNQRTYATTVAQQIVKAAQIDKTIIGVMGWPFSGSTQDVNRVLSAAHIPMVTATVSDDFLTGISPFLFRVVPSYKSQVLATVKFAEQRLHAKRAALFVDPHNMYSKNLAFDFQQQFIAAGNSIVVTEPYTVGHPEMPGALLANALRANPDLIYFAGAANDAMMLLMKLPTSGTFANLPVIGGDSLAGAGSYPRSVSNGFNRLYFSESVAFNEWEASGLSSKKPAFFTEYTQYFDPNRQHPANLQGYSRANSSNILTYDAILALLSGSRIALSAGKQHPSPDDLRQGLIKITGTQAIQGASGQIVFGSDGDPVNKAVPVVKLNVQGDFTVEAIYGTLLVNV